ncbi:MAG TPA: hypothetical protein VFL03_14520 [Candidatus Limnocylindrales bacterium]|nr:hypothetical protein [Candidatus Limnocylindrales bacterium]
MARPVYVVHCVDTEGPLHESVDATFERLKAIFGLDLEPSVALLRQLQAGEVDLGGIESAVRKVVDPHLLAYNDTWDKVDDMLASCMSPEFREQTLDSDGRGWVYNWFCVDHVDYDVNPRRRDIGYHNVFDHYQGVIRETGSAQDGVQLHYHPHAFSRVANHSATHWWASSDSLGQVLSRRVIDRQWFPAAHRAGFHVTRPDSHWFLEQHIPFDLSSQAVAAVAEDSAQSGLDDGRWGDWRRAPVTWEPYHPAHDDYESRGSCRRWIARCLNIGTRYRLLAEEHVRQAFAEAEADRPVVLAFTNHDFRDMRPDIEGVRELLVRVGREFPDVPFRFSEAVTAMREALQLPVEAACDMAVTLTRTGPATHVLEIRSQVPTFGPQPWLALRTKAGTYHHDNLDIDEPFHHWRYVFDDQTFPVGALDGIGLAANNAFGVTTVVNVDPATGAASRRVLNDPSAAVAATRES